MWMYFWVCNLKKFEKPHCVFSLSSPHCLPHFSVIRQAAQLLALSPPAQDPLDFSPAKELYTVPQPRLLTCASSLSLLLVLSPFHTCSFLVSTHLHFVCLINLSTLSSIYLHFSIFIHHPVSVYHPHQSMMLYLYKIYSIFLVQILFLKLLTLI